jgi:enoyl-[acyl-carrier protein] reductase II
MLHTDICDLFEVEVPILLAGMGGVAMAELTAAVSNAGGLGVLGGAMLDADGLRREIRKTRELTDKPFAVDLLAPIPEQIRPHMKVIFEEKIRIFVAGLAVPGPFIADMHEHGMKVVVMCGKVRHAMKAEQAGADCVAAQGTEAGGHTGEIGTLALIPQVVDAVKIPVLAAGGIADGRGIAASLALGAKGVVIGTRFCAATEAVAARAYQRALVEGFDDSTVRTRCYTGKPARAIRNAYTTEWEGHPQDIQPYPLQVMQSVQAGVFDYSGRRGDADPLRTFMPAGQALGLIRDVRPAGEIVRDLMRETSAAIRSIQPLA